MAFGQIVEKIKSNIFKIPKGVSGGFDKGCVGLNIGNQSIKIAELRIGGKKWKLLHFGKAFIPRDTINSREISNALALVESIRALTAQLKLNSKKVALSISGNSVITKKMTIEISKRANAKEIEEQAFWEAEQYLPFDIAEVYLDSYTLSKAKDGTVDVMLVAAKKNLIDTYVACISDAGLVPEIVDIDYFALQNIFEINYPERFSDANMIVDIGASSLKIVVLQNGIPLYTKESALGGDKVTSEIQNQLGLSFEDAETLKISQTGAEVPQEISDLLTVSAENFAIEIKRGLDFYNASSTGASPSKIYLTGGASLMANTKEMVQDICKIEVEKLNPFNLIEYDKGTFTEDYINQIAPFSALALGLAIRAGNGK